MSLNEQVKTRATAGEKSKDEVVQGTRRVGSWWLMNRKKKLLDTAKETININPFLLPMLMNYHGLDSVEELGNLLIGAHLVGGHFTGFGKLFDEKLLPHVFGTQKFDQKYRNTTAPYSHAAFNDIDHAVSRDGYIDLLSLKSSPWTINLGGSKDLNASFAQIRDYYIRPNKNQYGEIAVGVLYGQESTLTDKYMILNGSDPQKNIKHNVVDLTDTVRVYAGKDFWAWLNFGIEDTQDWILQGLIEAANNVADKEDQKEIINRLVSDSESFKYLSIKDGFPDWLSVLRRVNG